MDLECTSRRIPLCWKEYQVALDEDQGTTNMSEKWNSVSKAGINNHRLSLLQKEEALARTTIHSIALGTVEVYL